MISAGIRRKRGIGSDYTKIKTWKQDNNDNKRWQDFHLQCDWHVDTEIRTRKKKSMRLIQRERKGVREKERETHSTWWMQAEVIEHAEKALAVLIIKTSLQHHKRPAQLVKRASNGNICIYFSFVQDERKWEVWKKISRGGKPNASWPSADRIMSKRCGVWA